MNDLQQLQVLWGRWSFKQRFLFVILIWWLLPLQWFLYGAYTLGEMARSLNNTIWYEMRRYFLARKEESQ